MASWSKLTYQRRLFLGLVVYSWVLVACFAVFQYHREKDFKARELNIGLQAVNSRILEDLAEDGWDAALSKAIAGRGVRVSVIGLDGTVIHDNCPDSIRFGNHLSRKEICSALRSGEGFALRPSESTGQTYFYSARRGGDFIVRTAVPYSVSLGHLLEADYGFLWIMAVITTVMCIAGYFATRRVGLHVERLSRFADSAERGERITDTEPFPHDELGEISQHIIRLYSQLQEATAERDRQHRLALHEEQEKIRIKRQLTNNINHELKTPVASMKVCLETLMSRKNLPEEKRDEFLARCNNANERLRRLLDDVSSITRMEDGGDTICRQKVDLRAIVGEVCRDYAPEAEEKGVSIINEISYDIPFEGNASLLVSVFSNLLSNALAYSGATEISLRQSPAPWGGKLIIRVSDNGCGVAPEHLPRLFERFYRVDKGRSRMAGGTGLGLAIVKNAVLWHGGSIHVGNLRTGGLSFTIVLPV